MHVYYNPNPIHKRVGDCTVRALSKVLDKKWEETFIGLCVQALMMCDMPNADSVWSQYLKDLGWKRRVVPSECDGCYTVEDFCRDHPKGMFLLALDSHVIAVKDGDYYDTWDSGDETPIYYYEREDLS